MHTWAGVFPSKQHFSDKSQSKAGSLHFLKQTPAPLDPLLKVQRAVDGHSLLLAHESPI
jgi:hypothetical protein